MEPHDSHRNGDLTPAVNIPLDETILTLSGFTVENKNRNVERKNRYHINYSSRRVWL